jgi:hypothetical protein
MGEENRVENQDLFGIPFGPGDLLTYRLQMVS